MITVIALMLAILHPWQSSKWGQPIETPETCWSEYLGRMEQCRMDHPDATTIARATCEANAAGQYTACINGLN